MKVLIIQSDSLGRVVMSTPVIRLLKTQLDAEVHFATQESFLPALEKNPYLDVFHSIEDSADKRNNELKKHAFDLVIDLENSWRSFWIRFFLKGQKIVYRKKKFNTWICLKLGLKLSPQKHLTDQYIEMLSSVGIKSDSLGLDYHIPDKDEVELEWLPKSHQQGYAAFVIEASKNTKQLPINRMIELCDRINKPIVLIGNNDNGAAKEIEQFFLPGSEGEEKEIEALNKKASIFNACGKFNLNQNASLLNQASWVFTHDNDFMHIAAALNKQIFSIWGSSTANFGEYPYRTKFTIFENNKISCRPCAIGGYNHCPKGHFKCMNDLTFDFYLPD